MAQQPQQRATAKAATPLLQHVLESLERRVLMDASAAGGDLPFVAYYPEGYAHDGINEFVPITNNSDEEVRFELHARYETGERDQLVASGVIAPHSRGGVTLNAADRPEERLVRKDVPYALELRASAPVGATMSHYDFGTAIGESFTTTTDIEWTFAEGYKDPENTRDFLVFYNPGERDAHVAVVIYSADGRAFPLVSTVGAGRRGGWNINEEASIPFGGFTVQVVSSEPIVAAMSRYDLRGGRGAGFIGTPGGGATAGVLPSVTFDADNRGETDPELDAQSYIGLLNTDQVHTANVTLRFLPLNGEPEVPDMTVAVPPQVRGGVSIRDLNLPPGQYGIAYRSDIPITATSSVYQGRDGTGMESIIDASTRWEFGEGFMSPARAGKTVTENLNLYNPGGEAVDVTVDFSFSDGTVHTLTRRLEARAAATVAIHEIPEVAALGYDSFYGIRVSADEPIAASFEHWDDDLGGGFATPGTPTGEIRPISEIASA